MIWSSPYKKSFRGKFFTEVWTHVKIPGFWMQCRKFSKFKNIVFSDIYFFLNFKYFYHNKFCRNFLKLYFNLISWKSKLDEKSERNVKFKNKQILQLQLKTMKFKMRPSWKLKNKLYDDVFSRVKILDRQELTKLAHFKIRKL